jgi:hypothetical protein
VSNSSNPFEREPAARPAPSSEGGDEGDGHPPIQFDAAIGAGGPGGAGLSPSDLARGGYTGLERKRGAGRRLSEFGRSAEEGELNREQFLFLMAIEEFKRGNATPYPAWSDVLEVVRLLGYRKTMASEITLRNAEDWTEKPDVPSNVRPQGWERRFRIVAAGGEDKKNPGRGPRKHAA